MKNCIPKCLKAAYNKVKQFFRVSECPKCDRQLLRLIAEGVAIVHEGQAITLEELDLLHVKVDRLTKLVESLLPVSYSAHPRHVAEPRRIPVGY